MADIFISYKREDRDFARAIARLLRRRRLSVWWDTSLSAGESFAPEIFRQALAARVIIVCWSRAASASRWVHAEMSVGLARGNLLPTRLDKSDLPQELSRLHVIDFSRWDLTDFADEIDQLLLEVERVSGKPLASIDTSALLDPATGEPLGHYLPNLSAAHPGMSLPNHPGLNRRQRIFTCLLASFAPGVLLAAVVSSGLIATEGALSGLVSFLLLLCWFVPPFFASLFVGPGLRVSAGWSVLSISIAFLVVIIAVASVEQRSTYFTFALFLGVPALASLVAVWLRRVALLWRRGSILRRSRSTK